MFDASRAYSPSSVVLVRTRSGAEHAARDRRRALLGASMPGALRRRSWRRRGGCCLGSSRTCLQHDHLTRLDRARRRPAPSSPSSSSSASVREHGRRGGRAARPPWPLHRALALVARPPSPGRWSSVATLRRAPVSTATAFTFRLATLAPAMPGGGAADEPGQSLHHATPLASSLAAQAPHGPRRAGADGDGLDHRRADSAARATRLPPDIAPLMASAEPSTRSKRSRSSRASSITARASAVDARSSRSSGPGLGAQRLDLAAQRLQRVEHPHQHHDERGEADAAQHGGHERLPVLLRSSLLPRVRCSIRSRHLVPRAPWSRRLVVALVGLFGRAGTAARPSHPDGHEGTRSPRRGRGPCAPW